MKDERKTKKQLIDELVQLRQQLSQERCQLSQEGGQLDETHHRADELTPRDHDHLVRQQMEELLRASVEQWYTIYNAMNDAICLLDSQNRIQRCNRAMVELLDRPLGEILGRHCWEVVHGTSGPIDECPIVRMQATLSRERRVVPLGDRWFDVSVDPLLADNGQNVGAVHVMMDITERVRSEEKRARAQAALRESEELLRITLENILDPIFITDDTGEFTFICPNVPNTLGYSVEEICALGNISLLIRGDLPLHQELYALGEIRDIEGNIETKSGDTRDFLVSAKRVSIGDGTILYSCHDITERKKAQDALQVSQQKLHLALEGAIADSWEMDLAAGTLTFGDHWAVHMGYEPGEIAQTMEAIQGIVHPDDLQRTFDDLNAYIEGETPLYETECRLRRKDGDHVWVVSRGQAVAHDREGRPTRLIGTNFDITERKQAEEKLRASRRMLQTVLDSIPTAVFWKDRDSVYLGGNRTWLEAAGLESSEEAVGKSDYDLPWEKKQADSFREDDRKVMESGIPAYGIIESYLRSDGTNAWAKTNKVPLQDTDGNVVGILGTYEDITDRKLAEEALRDSEERYRMVFENSPVSIWEEDFSGVKCLFDDLKMEGVTDIETYLAEHPEAVRQCVDLTKIVDVNRATLALHRTTNKEELLAGLVDVFTPESFDTFRLELVSLWDGETEMVRDTVVKTLAGEPRNVTVYVSVCPGYEETLSKVFVSLIDITERKRAEEALTLFRSLIDHTNDVIEVIDPETGRFLDVNEQACLALGYTREEYLALTVPQINPELSDLSWKEAMEITRRSGFPIRESQHRRKDGSIFPVEISTNYIHLDRDYVLAVVRDITERKQAEQELQRSNDLLRAIIEAAPTAIIGLDLDGNVQTVWNPAAEKMLGWSAQEVMGHPLPSVPEEGQEEFRGFRERIRSDKTIDGVEVRRQRRDGSPIDYSIYASPLHDAEGQIAGNIAVLVDITERKQAEQERLASLHFLECMDRVNRAIQGTNDLEQMMGDVLDEVLSIFDCDRAFLLYPCDPEAASWSAPMERTKPEYPGAHAKGLEAPMDPDVARVYRLLLESDGPVKFGPESVHPLPREMSRLFGYKSQMLMALYPKTGAPWVFGLHQCSYPRVWTQQEERLLQEIGWPLTNSLTGLLMYRNLKERENKYRELASSITDIFFAMDTDLKYTYWNRASENLTGIKAEDAVGKTIFEILPDTKETRKAAAVYQEVLKKKQPQSFENEYRLEDKHYFFEINAYPTEDGIAIFAKDITERKQMAQALALREQEYRTLLENVPDFIVRYDQDLRRTYVNPAWEKASGLSREEVISVPAADIPKVPQPTNEEYVEKLKQVLATGTPQAIEFTWVNAYGVLLFLGYVIVPEYDRSGKIVGALAVGRDVTERKRVQEELARQAEQLRLLSARLAEAQEVEWRRIARELHDQVGQNLTALGINLNTLVPHLAQAPEEAQSCLNDSLGLVKQTTGRIRDVMADLRPPELDDYGLLSALRWYAGHIGARTGLAVAVEGESIHPRLSSQQETALFRIAQEALTNVTKHAQVTQATVTLEASEERVRMIIADDGVGFEPASLETTNETPHWGLLTMKERAQAIAARWRVESSPGGGTRVVVEMARPGGGE